MFNRTLSSFVPAVYDNVVEMDDIIAAEEREMDLARREMASAFANTFVLTANDSGVIMFERMLGITANTKTEDLEFRRNRVLNRMSMSPPFTFRFLKQKLDEIVGVNAWKAYIDFNNYTLYVESSATNQVWYYEVEFTVTHLKPCNMVFINVPYSSTTVDISEEIHYTTVNWAYRLGSWKLGHTPFSTPDAGGIIKMSNIKSVQPALLSDAASFVAEDISSVLINDTINITEFRVKQVSNNEVTLEYAVTSNMTTLITSIKLIRADGEVLTQASVYVPVAQTVFSKHLISVKEGV